MEVLANGFLMREVSLPELLWNTNNENYKAKDNMNPVIENTPVQNYRISNE